MEYTNNQKRELVKKDYNAIANVYTKSYGNDISDYYFFIEKFLNILKEKNVLDVGCGSGQICDYLYKKGVCVKGIDFSEKLLNIAKKNNPNIEYINEDITKYKTDEKFGGIFSKDMLFHLPNEDMINVLKILYSILKPKGKICIIMDMQKNEGEHFYVEELDDSQKIYYNYLSQIKMEKLVESVGFIILEKHIIEENEHAGSYAQGLMVFYAEKK